MPNWFSKVFPAERKPPAAEAIQMRNPILDDEDFQREQAEDQRRPRLAATRRVIEPKILVDEKDTSAFSDAVRIKLRPGKSARDSVFLVDRPLLEGYSACFTSPADAAGRSPLAEAIFGVEGVDSVSIHGMTLSVTRDPRVRGGWKELAEAIGARIREHLKAGRAVVTEAFLADLPSPESISARLQDVLDKEINPSIASHSGAIELDRVEGNTVYIRMLGGCQGCAASSITLRQGVHQAFREAEPRIGEILDVTEHAAGANPYYRQLPAGMPPNA